VPRREEERDRVAAAANGKQNPVRPPKPEGPFDEIDFRHRFFQEVSRSWLSQSGEMEDIERPSF